VNGSAKSPAMTPAGAALVLLMERYLRGLLDPFVSLREFQPLAYFLQQVGEPLGLRFAKGSHGPDAEHVRRLIAEIEGHCVTAFGAAGGALDRPLELLPGALDQARAALAERTETRERFDRVARLIEGFESPFGLELLATVHWVMTREAAASDEDVVAHTYARADRRRRFTEEQVALARRVLQERGFGMEKR